MVLFLILLTSCWVRATFCCSVIRGMLMCSLCCDCWEVFVFLAGAPLAETDLMLLIEITLAPQAEWGWENEIAREKTYSSTRIPDDQDGSNSLPEFVLIQPGWWHDHQEEAMTWN